jgi:RNA polymerase sigma factor (sigma-70 family)
MVLYKYSYHSHNEEKKIVESILDGNSNDFEPLFHKYKGIFFSNLMKWYPNYYSEQEGLDMAMEFLEMIFTKLHTYNPKKSVFGTWITNCMRNFMIGHYRKMNKKSNLKYKSFEEIFNIDKDGNVSSFDIPVEENATKLIEIKRYKILLNKIIECLDPLEYIIVSELFFNGRTIKEVAEIVGLKRTTLDYRLKRMRKKIEKYKPF